MVIDYSMASEFPLGCVAVLVAFDVTTPSRVRAGARIAS